MEWAAIILTGGTARRLGGVDKASLVVEGQTLIERSLAAVVAAADVVVVGEPVSTSRGVRFTREQPAYGGPAAAVVAGLAEVTADLVAVLAVDLAFVTASTMSRLLDGAIGHDGAVLVDGGRHHLALVVRRAALAAVVPDQTTGLALWKLLAPLDLAEVPALGDEARDIDTWADLGG
jgi:molybdopterin-guanine dinucleotide biosynthesis protein A